MALVHGFASVNVEPAAAAEEQLTLEAQESRLCAAYSTALDLVQAKREDEAEAALRQLLQAPAVAECATDKLERVKFLGLKNLADLLARHPQGVREALGFYCQATEVVSDDVGLWNKLGTLAAEAGYWAVARHAFERGLELEPLHPSMADKLLQLLLYVGDTEAAPQLAAALLQHNPRHTTARAVLNQQAAPSAGLLELGMPAGTAAGGQVAATAAQRAHGGDRERPRTLEEPTWQQLLHHSLLFLASNHLAEGSSAVGGTTASAATAAKPAGQSHRGPAALVRFNYKRPQQQQQQLPGAAAQGEGREQADASSPAAAAADGTVVAVQAQHGAVDQPVAQATLARATADHNLAGSTDAAADTAGSPMPTPAAAESTPGANVPSTAVEPAASVQHQQQLLQGAQAPDSDRSEKRETRTTRSRAATGKAEPGPAASSAVSAEETPERDAWELLHELGQLLSSTSARIVAGTAGPSPLSPAGGRHRAGTQQVLAADAAPGPHQQDTEEQAVKAFLKALPPQGIGRQQLVQRLLAALATISGASALSPAARLQLLQLVQKVEHDMPHPSLEQCLVLGELFVDAAAPAAASSPGQRGSRANLLASSSSLAPPPPVSSCTLQPRRQGCSTFGRPLGGTRGRRGELTKESLLKSAQLFLLRYRLAEAQAVPRAAVAGQHGVSEQQQQRSARCWWATGKLLELTGDMVAAGTAYDNCLQLLGPLGEESIELPHCREHSSVSLVSVHAKQEALQLYSILRSSEQANADGDHAAVVAALVPVLLSCSGKEQQMLQHDRQQWLHGMQLLLAAATASSNWTAALQCHLRLLNALLPEAPPELLSAMEEHQDGATAGSQFNTSLHSLAKELAHLPAAAGALNAAACFFQQHHAALELLPSSTIAGCGVGNQAGARQSVSLHPMEVAILKAVHQQLAAAVVSSSAALATAGPMAAESRLNMQVNAHRGVLCDAATVLLHLSSLCGGWAQVPPEVSTSSSVDVERVEQAIDVSWHLCNTLGEAQALMERHGRFVEGCLSELHALLKAVLPATKHGPTHASAASGAAAGLLVSQVEELRHFLVSGLHHCLYWLYGLELPGFDKQEEEWGGGYAVKGNPEHLNTHERLTAIWSLVDGPLVSDVEHILKYEGFLRAAQALCSQPLPGVVSASEVEWRRLAAVEPPTLPCNGLNVSLASSPLKKLLELAAAGQLVVSSPAGGGLPITEAMMVDSDALVDPEIHSQVSVSLYHLLSSLQDALAEGVDYLGAGAEAAVDQQLQMAKWDLHFNPRRFSSWERLAAGYHEAADGLLNVASKALSHREWTYSREMQTRARRWRRLAYWASLGAWLCARATEDHEMLLRATGANQLRDVVRILPWQDPIGSASPWQQAKRGSLYQSSCTRALAAFEAAQGMADKRGEGPDWELLLQLARCQRKLRQPAAKWLPLMARACHYAGQDDGGVLLPVYALHASRMRLLLSMPLAQQWASYDSEQATSSNLASRSELHSQQELEQQSELLLLVSSYCFLPSTKQAMCSPAQLATTCAAATPSLADLQADWDRLLEDCMTAMRWCLDKDKSFHRAAHRLAAAMRFKRQYREAVGLLAPFFTRKKDAFFPAMAAIQDTKVVSSGRRGQRSIARRDSRAEVGQAEECSWGQAPPRLSSVGLQEDNAFFYSRLRKTMHLYLTCLEGAAQVAADDAGAEPLHVLQAATAHFTAGPSGLNKALEGCDRLARGHFLLALVSVLNVHCPLEQLEPSPPLTLSKSQGPVTGLESQGLPQPALQATPGAGIEAHPSPLPSETPAARGGAHAGLQPTPTTAVRQQFAAHLLQVAARLDASKVEPLLALAYQTFADYSLHADACDKWRAVAAPSMHEAFSFSSGGQPRDLISSLHEQPELLSKVFRLHATLYVRFLQQQGAADKLLSLLPALKKRIKGINAADQGHSRALRQHVVMVVDALLGTLEASLAAAEHQFATAEQQPLQVGKLQEELAGENMDVDHVNAQVADVAAAEPSQPRQFSGKQQCQRPGSPANSQQQVQAGPQASASPARPSSSSEQTPADASADGVTPGRAALGAPAIIPTAEAQAAQEQVASLFVCTHNFHRELIRLLPAVGVGRDQQRALCASSEAALLRAYRLYQPATDLSSSMNKAELLKAMDEAARGQRRQSRQHGARQPAGAGAAEGAGLPPIAEGGQEDVQLAGCKRPASNSPGASQQQKQARCAPLE